MKGLSNAKQIMSLAVNALKHGNRVLLQAIHNVLTLNQQEHVKFTELTSRNSNKTPHGVQFIKSVANSRVKTTNHKHHMNGTKERARRRYQSTYVLAGTTLRV